MSWLPWLPAGSEQLPQLLGRHADDGQDVPQGALGYSTAGVDRYDNRAAVRMAHDMMAAADPNHRESGTFERLDHLCP